MGEVKNVGGVQSGSDVGTAPKKNDAYYNEIQRKKDQEAFDTEKGWGGIAGAAKKPRGKIYDDQFEAWRKARAAKAGQAKAVTK